MGYSVKKISDVIVKDNDGKNQIVLRANLLKGASLTLRAINHPLRKAIVDYLEENGEKTVTEIFVKLRTEQSVASQHLAILRKAELLNTRRDGKFIHYTINRDRFKQLAGIIEDLS